jgi:hypothetical protein
MEKKKRIVTRIGNVFCIEIENTYKRYFQYIANDMTQLNSSVIRVFKKNYPFDSNPSVEDIVQDEVAFYIHTMLRPGIVEGVWYKVGNCKNIGYPEQVMFRSNSDFGNEPEKSYNWYIWYINSPKVKIGEMTDLYSSVDIGSVYPYKEVLHRIKTGKPLFKVPK